MSVTPRSLTCVSKMGWETEGDQDSDAEQAEERWCAGVEVRQRMGSKEGWTLPPIYASVSSVKQGSFLCTYVAQRKMQQKGNRKHRKGKL